MKGKRKRFSDCQIKQTLICFANSRTFPIGLGVSHEFAYVIAPRRSIFISSSFLYSSPSSVQCLCTAADLSAYFEALSFYKSPLARGEGLTRCRHICIIQQQLSNLCGWQCLPLTRCQLTQIRLVSRTPFFFPFFKPK